MNYVATFTLAYFGLAAISFLMFVLYVLNGFEKGKRQDFNHEKGLFLFIILWFGTLGLFSTYANEIAKWLRDYWLLLGFLTVICLINTGRYLFKLKNRRLLLYGVLEITFGCTAILLVVKPLSDNSLTPIMTALISITSSLYVVVRGLENIDKAVKENVDKAVKKYVLFYPYWNVFKNF